MEFKIIWPDFADFQFSEIYNYYHTNISKQVAKMIAKNILSATQKLETAPYVGQKEDLLLDRSKEYRYLIYTNYKIIYSVDEKLIL